MKNRISLLFLAISVFQFGSAQNDQMVTNLTAFSKAYGYVKYFHPSDEAFDLDWDAFSAYGAEKVEECKNNKELVKTLNEMFKQIAPSATFVLSNTVTHYNSVQITPKDTSGLKPIFWQHKGVSIGMRFNKEKDRLYKSIRVNKEIKVCTSDDFGNIITSVVPKGLEGKDFKYEGWAKIGKNSSGKGQLWFRVDRSDKKKGFFNNSIDNPVKRNEWQHFEIKGTIDSLAKKLVFGCFLNGKGELYLDDLKLSIKKNDKWEEIPIKNSSFEVEEIDTAKVDSIQWSGEGEGYVFSIDDNEVHSGKKSAKIQYVGKCYEDGKEPLFDCAPEFGEIIEKEIVDGVFCQIPLVLYGNKNLTYPEGDQKSINKLEKRFSKVSEDPTDLYTRLGNIIIIYNVFQHFFSYFDVVDVDWDSEFIKAIKRSYTDSNGKEHLITLQKMTAPLNDGHARFWSNFTEYYMPPLTLEWIEDMLIVTHVMDTSFNLKKGDVVELINDISPEDFFKEVESTISAATKGYMDYVAKLICIMGEKGSEIKLKINGKDYNLLREYTYPEVTATIKNKPAKHKIYDNDIFYVNLNRMPMDTINSLMPQLEQSKAIIFDMRGYPGKKAYDLISHLLKHEVNDSSCFQISQIIYPDHERLCGYKKTGWRLKPEEPYLGDKEIIFITDGRAISYSESFMSYIEDYDLATIVGQPTAGTNGNINPFYLPGWYYVKWTGMKVVKHDGSQFHGIGILPDVYVNKTIKGIVEGRDEFLEKAFEIARSRIENTGPNQ